MEIRDDLKSRIPPLSTEEYRQLEQNIIADGCRDPLVVWDDVIIDGHNRYAICTERGIEFDTKPIEFESMEDAKDWIDANQLGRRNLTPDQRRIIIGRRYNREKKIQRGGGDRGNQYTGGKSANLAQMPTADKLAEENKTSPRTVKNYAKDAEMYDSLERDEPETAEAIWKGEKRLTAVKKAHVSNNSGNNEWYTPRKYIDSAREVMGSITLDPASCELANKTVGADAFFSETDNGLEQDWVGSVYLNPPYAQPLIGKFCKKVVEEYANGNIEQAVVLVNNATETIFFQEMARVCSAICFPKGRIKFIDNEGNPSGAPLQGQAILYFGDGVDVFISEFSQYGFCTKVLK